MNIAIYLRKSRMDPEDESTAETLSRHKKTLLQYAAKSGLTILDIYEEVVSGDGLFVRPEMVKLMDAVEKEKYDGVLCMDIDRLGRVDTRDRGIILDTFKTSNTIILTPNKTYNLNDELDEFSTEIQMLFARQELKKITGRLQAGMRRTVQDGYHIGEPPYGYRRVYIDKRPTLEICEEEAKIIRMVFDMYVNQGCGSHSIANYLNSLGLKPRKNDVFSRTTIQFYLQNEIYIGKIVWNKRHHLKKKRPTDKHRQILNPREEWIVSEGVHPAIIDEETFYRAQEIRLTHYHPPTYRGIIENSFAGLIKCKNCGMTMQRQGSSLKGVRLLCTKPGCNRSIKMEYVDNAVYDYLVALLKKYKSAINEKKTKKDRLPELSTQLQIVKGQLTTLKNQKNTLHDLLEQGVYDIKTFTERGKIITTKISSLENELENIRAALNSDDNGPTLRDILPTLELLVENYYTMPPSEKNKMLKKVIKCIYYKRTPEHSPGEFNIEIITVL